jgi:hypothetical protein
MIQLQEQALIICHEDGRMEPIHLNDLITQLTADSELPGILDPWILEKIVESIIHHFRYELQKEFVPLTEFIALTKQLLESFFREALEKGQSFLQLDLFETARNCGNGFELEFYNVVRRSLQQYLESSFAQKLKVEMEESKNRCTFRITGLRQCAKFLSGQQRWSKNCSEVSDEIIAFIRAEVAKTDAPDLSLAVLS